MRERSLMQYFQVKVVETSGVREQRLFLAFFKDAGRKVRDIRDGMFKRCSHYQKSRQTISGMSVESNFPSQIRQTSLIVFSAEVYTYTKLLGTLQCFTGCAKYTTQKFRTWPLTRSSQSHRLCPGSMGHLPAASGQRRRDSTQG
jgi:hypothetical protein